MMNKVVRIPAETLRQQFASSDPEVSAWVSANAGSGKTHVLTQRVIRLMLAGNDPDRILCLTFTKAAAANMKNRVFDTLAKWTMMDDTELDEEITKLSGKPPSNKERREVRKLFARALDTPGGLKIQTIHAFCEGLLHQFPLEANVPGHFETLQEAGQAELLMQAKSDVVGRANDANSILDHYSALVSTVSADAIDKGIDAVIAIRNAFNHWTENGIDAATHHLADVLNVSLSDDEASIIERGLFDLSHHADQLAELVSIANDSPNSTDHKQAALLNSYLRSDDPDDQFQTMAKITLTGKGEPRSEKRIVTGFVKERMQDAASLLADCGEAVLAIQEKLNTYSLVINSAHLFHIAAAVLERYESLKRARGLIDFDDQVEKCANLLTRADIREWIRYRLDRGIDHMLVDEAQDTSPRQWEVINAITADFHSGITAAKQQRTVFVVGDEKQSIYSFQGAQPEEFARQEKTLKQSVESAQKPYHPGNLSLSFRSTADVLHAVDTVFKSEQNRVGLTQSGDQPVHDAIRSNDPGEVQVWPLFERQGQAEAADWMTPVDHEGRSDPAVRLAERITESIGEWVGKPLPGSSEPLKFGDILVLVRKRDRFITALTRTMKDAGLSVAGSDRITLTQHIAVEDLLAIGQFALLPEDDLNLACVLKSVLFNVDEEFLFRLTHTRDGTLEAAIQSACESSDLDFAKRAQRIADQLSSLKTHARALDVFEFYAWLLGPLGLRRAFLARLGMEAEDVLDAFLDETLSFTREGGIGMENFIASLKRTNPEIKREVELDRDEVRILTVHASKGLEAKVVFLVDPCNAPWTERHRPKILSLASSNGLSYAWLPTAANHTSYTRKVSEEIRVSAEGEYRRLLYVGMTRAADRLVVCGYCGQHKPAFEHWHKMVSDALEPDGEPVTDADGNQTNLIWHSKTSSRTTAPPETAETAEPTLTPSVALPKWATSLATPEPPLPSPLSPAGAYALIDAEGSVPPVTGQSGLSANPFALERGIAMHKLLEALPGVSSELWEKKAIAYLKRVAAEWTQGQRDEVWESVKSILTDETFSNLFTDHSKSEVLISGWLDTRSGKRMITGQIDRLVVLKDKVLVLDYKTGSVVPDNIHQTPPDYVAQLALYREMVCQVFPEKRVECALLWTRKPEIVNVPSAMLDEALVKIKNI